ncbi:uncharacterized protein Z519_02393 [Cladophialophora bantiana CBS 173.52]|uniref:Uncharacterized protein n=1 Tax=Cladophialophora bantiana (strain ATCC 10958 / CBS 173.52 / CDC B-1940 / NIH 8579) TaxID=1442370 RepID=A0A0D2GF90_CLAB1|nr:uncharacterized protein Z519_02393 [Cladophialophora bantiana CBS 173.52]KIW97002.1 hypothetical protein Z519_02393 [Cladophialophora bantiana CBS 173.52]
MDDLPIIKPRDTTGPMGFLNYPPEIMNMIYDELFVDDHQILCFLCSPDPALSTIGLKQVVNRPQVSSTEDLDWSQLYDSRYYVDSHGLSAQFLRVCKRIWSEGSTVLYGSLNIAMRWTPKPDPCLGRFFKRNTKLVLATANVIYPRSAAWAMLTKDYSFNILHWGLAHPAENWDLDRQTLRRIREERLFERGRRSLRVRSRSATF